MNAAEKLKALESQLVPGMAGDVRTLAYALPQIVALVEAAEGFVPHMDDEGGCHPDRYGVDCPEWLAIPAALDALDEALKHVSLETT